MDNAGSHITEKTKQFALQNEIKIIFGAPNTPTFNPIELLFNTWKQRVSNRIYNDSNELINSIMDQAQVIADNGIIPSFIEKSANEWNTYLERSFKEFAKISENNYFNDILEQSKKKKKKKK